MKSFKKIKSYDTIIMNHDNEDINEVFSKQDDDTISFYLPLEEGVLKKYDTYNSMNIISYTYFKVNEDESFDLEFYVFFKDNYEFRHLLTINITNISENGIDHEYTLKWYDKDSYDNDKIANSNAFKLINKFVKVMCYIIIVKDNKNIVYKKVEHTETIKSSANNTSNHKYKRKNIEVINKDKVIYSLDIKSENGYKQFKKSYTRHTESWQVMGFARHYKSGKVVYVKPHIRGNKNKKVEKKEYIIK